MADDPVRLVVAGETALNFWIEVDGSELLVTVTQEALRDGLGFKGRMLAEGADFYLRHRTIIDAAAHRVHGLRGEPVVVVRGDF